MSPVDRAWSGLLTTALLGTARRELPPAPGPPLDGFGVGAVEPAVALLDRAAALVVARRAGARPAPAPPLLAPAPPDARRPCPPAAARRLARLVAGEHPELLDEWLDRAVVAGVAVPAEHLAALVDRAAGDPASSARVAAAAGPLAGWLAALLPGFDRLAVATVAGRDRWQTGTLDERVAALAAWRGDDADGARDALVATLPDERAPARARLLGVLAVGLGPADEPLLEALLDDRSADVRAQAAELLADLPWSAFAGRQADRLAAVAQAVAGRHGPVLELALPAELPADWRRDGLAPRPRAGVSAAASMAAALVSAAPLRAWAAVGPPETVAAAVAAHGDAAVLLPALVGAVVRAGDAGWAAALLGVTPAVELLPVVSPAVLAGIVRDLAVPSALLQPFTAAACRALAEPWPDDAARAVLGALVALFEGGRVTWGHRGALARLVAALDPRLLLPLSTALANGAVHPHLGALQPAVAEQARFRHDLIEELS